MQIILFFYFVLIFILIIAKPNSPCWIRTNECGNQNPMPYLLANGLYKQTITCDKHGQMGGPS